MLKRVQPLPGAPPVQAFKTHHIATYRDMTSYLSTGILKIGVKMRSISAGIVELQDSTLCQGVNKAPQWLAICKVSGWMWPQPYRSASKNDCSVVLYVKLLLLMMTGLTVKSPCSQQRIDVRLRRKLTCIC